nr:MAG TPA: hypothetical protein [Caudoviricetes sp.]
MSSTKYILTFDGGFLSEDELYHYGVPGMKWGVRKETDPAVVNARAAYETAKKAYNKSFSNAYKRGIDAYSLSKKTRQANVKRWNDAEKKAEEYRKAKDAYKTAKNMAKSKTKVSKPPVGEYEKERNRQKKYLATKRAVDLGSRFVNEYTKRNNMTLNGKHVGVSDSAKLFVNAVLDYKYMKNTFK